MKITDFKKIIYYFNPNTTEGKNVRPLRDWKILLVISIICAGIATAIDLSIIFRHTDNFQKLGEKEKNEISTNNKLNQVLLESALSEIKKRQKRLEENLTAPAIKDPALDGLKPTVTGPKDSLLLNF